MYLITLFAIIVKLVFVSGDCDVGALNASSFDVTKFSGIWFWQYHNVNELDSQLVCPAVTFSESTGKVSRVATFGYEASTRRRIGFSGTVLSVNKVGYVEYDIPSIWSGRFNVLASDPDRYSIVLLCSEKMKKSFFYVATRRECPDKATLNAVDEALRPYNLSTKKLVKWCNVC